MTLRVEGPDPATGRELTVAASHPDGRLRLGDLRTLVHHADSDVNYSDVIDDSALVYVAAPLRDRATITVAEEGAQ